MEIVVGIVGLIGVFLGFLLNEGARLWREARAEKRQSRSVRKLLSIEIGENLLALEGFWDTLLVGADLSVDPYAVAARRFIGKPLPVWSHTMWESQMPLLAVALEDYEIAEIHYHHRLLDDLAAIQSTLTRLAEEHGNDRKAAMDWQGRSTPGSLYSLEREFESMASELWTKCFGTVQEILMIGNPLELEDDDD